jgi:hypothetical protein
MAHFSRVDGIVRWSVPLLAASFEGIELLGSHLSGLWFT